mmetsp:Transcript_6647/g.15252  ORF Transcript_6647/g.15252 Transcript_6647/m.15252 type:complete len:230 (+) Transcript_6647:146-835(+)
MIRAVLFLSRLETSSIICRRWARRSFFSSRVNWKLPPPPDNSTDTCRSNLVLPGDSELAVLLGRPRPAPLVSAMTGRKPLLLLEFMRGRKSTGWMTGVLFEYKSMLFRLSGALSVESEPWLGDRRRSSLGSLMKAPLSDKVRSGRKSVTKLSSPAPCMNEFLGKTDSRLTRFFSCSPWMLSPVLERFLNSSSSYASANVVLMTVIGKARMIGPVNMMKYPKSFPPKELG